MLNLVQHLFFFKNSQTNTEIQIQILNQVQDDKLCSYLPCAVKDCVDAFCRAASSF